MDYAKESLKKHYEWKGKIEMICRAPLKTRDDLRSEERSCRERV